DDLHKFGLIPEFIGRLPVVTTVSALDEDALVRVLTEPKNALTKQYRYLFSLDGVDLTFTDEAVSAIARLAAQRGTGARALSTIMEEVLSDTMYEVPSRPRVRALTITEDVVTSHAQATMLESVDATQPARQSA